ncbi:hypothetical protein BGZ94_004153, partial [Podila epigama]
MSTAASPIDGRTDVLSIPKIGAVVSTAVQSCTLSHPQLDHTLQGQPSQEQTHVQEKQAPPSSPHPSPSADYAPSLKLAEEINEINKIKAFRQLTTPIATDPNTTVSAVKFSPMDVSARISSLLAQTSSTPVASAATPEATPPPAVPEDLKVATELSELVHSQAHISTSAPVPVPIPIVSPTASKESESSSTTTQSTTPSSDTVTKRQVRSDSLTDARELLSSKESVDLPLSPPLSQEPLETSFSSNSSHGLADQHGPDSFFSHFDHGSPPPRKTLNWVNALPSHFESTVTNLPRKRRRRTNREELEILEDAFARNLLPDAATRQQLGARLGMSGRAVQIWFQNRRQTLRKKSITSSTSAGSSEEDAYRTHANTTAYGSFHSSLSSSYSSESLSMTSPTLSTKSYPGDDNLSVTIVAHTNNTNPSTTQLEQHTKPILDLARSSSSSSDTAASTITVVQDEKSILLHSETHRSLASSVSPSTTPPNDKGAQATVPQTQTQGPPLTSPKMVSVKVEPSSVPVIPLLIELDRASSLIPDVKVTQVQEQAQEHVRDQTQDQSQDQTQERAHNQAQPQAQPQAQVQVLTQTQAQTEAQVERTTHAQARSHAQGHVDAKPLPAPEMFPTIVDSRVAEHHLCMLLQEAKRRSEQGAAPVLALWPKTRNKAVLNPSLSGPLPTRTTVSIPQPTNRTMSAPSMRPNNHFGTAHSNRLVLKASRRNRAMPLDSSLPLSSSTMSPSYNKNLRLPSKGNVSLMEHVLNRQQHRYQQPSNFKQSALSLAGKPQHPSLSQAVRSRASPDPLSLSSSQCPTSSISSSTTGFSPAQLAQRLQRMVRANLKRIQSESALGQDAKSDQPPQLREGTKEPEPSYSYQKEEQAQRSTFGLGKTAGSARRLSIGRYLFDSDTDECSDADIHPSLRPSFRPQSHKRRSRTPAARATTTSLVPSAVEASPDGDETDDDLYFRNSNRKELKKRLSSNSIAHLSPNKVQKQDWHEKASHRMTLSQVAASPTREYGLELEKQQRPRVLEGTEQHLEQCFTVYPQAQPLIAVDDMTLQGQRRDSTETQVVPSKELNMDELECASVLVGLGWGR